MQHKLPPIPVRILLLLVIVSVGYYAFRSLQPEDNGALTASGTIEAIVVNVSPELAGKVKDVLVQEGQPAKLGDPLLMLDDSLLVSQRAVAVAQLDSAMAGVRSAQNALATAQTQYQITLEASLTQGESTRLQDRFSVLHARRTAPVDAGAGGDR
jgi:HlyD family secretion protein